MFGIRRVARVISTLWQDIRYYDALEVAHARTTEELIHLRRHVADVQRDCSRHLQEARDAREEVRKLRERSAVETKIKIAMLEQRSDEIAEKIASVADKAEPANPSNDSAITHSFVWERYRFCCLLRGQSDEVAGGVYDRGDGLYGWNCGSEPSGHGSLLTSVQEVESHVGQSADATFDRSAIQDLLGTHVEGEPVVATWRPDPVTTGRFILVRGEDVVASMSPDVAECRTQSVDPSQPTEITLICDDTDERVSFCEECAGKYYHVTSFDRTAIAHLLTPPVEDRPAFWDARADRLFLRYNGQDIAIVSKDGATFFALDGSRDMAHRSVFNGDSESMLGEFVTFCEDIAVKSYRVTRFDRAAIQNLLDSSGSSHDSTP